MTARRTDALADATASLRDRVDNPRLEAELLLAHILGISRSQLLTWPDKPLLPPARARFDALLARRINGEPMAYLLGQREFWSLSLVVTPDVLIPRPETEHLVEAALARMPADMPLSVADLGTGSGAIALAIASERPLARIIATDTSWRALQIARANARNHRLINIRFLAAHWLTAFASDAFDLIVSNPPYVALRDPHLERGDLRFEPRAALEAENDGLAALHTIIGTATAHLRPRGWLMVEHGHDQADAVTTMLRAAGFENIATERDLAATPRVSLAQSRGEPRRAPGRGQV